MRHPERSFRDTTRAIPSSTHCPAQLWSLGSQPQPLLVTLLAYTAGLVTACSSPVATVPGQLDAGLTQSRNSNDASANGLSGGSLLSASDASYASADPSLAALTPGLAPALAEPLLTDLPQDPVFADSKVSTHAPAFFAETPRTGGAPCIISPEPNTLMPRNWLRPRFEFVPAADENLFEIQISVEGFPHSSRAYARQRTYTMDANLWSILRTSVVDRRITVNVRALTLAADGTVRTGPSAPATSYFTIAPVPAPGKIVYWAILPGTMNGVLRGFGIGEENVLTVLTSSQLVPPTIDRPKQQVCVGCHSATPDGLGVGFSMGPPYWFRNSIADVTSANVGQKPAYVTDGQLATVRKLQGVPAFSRSHWTSGDHIALYMSSASRDNLVWVNLDTDGEQGTIARIGDSRKAVLPTFSHDGTTIAYVSSNSIQDGRLGRGPADIYVVPYNNRAGGDATPVSGASDPKYTEYYPSFSPDDAFIAFARVQGDADSYSNSASEVFVVPTKGGTATRLTANDPVACGKPVRSPGAGNDWPKWSPDLITGPNGKIYYWVTFSSIRRGRPQLYLAPMVVKDGVVDANYPALYLWNQPSTENNHTPSWDNYQIPEAPPAPVEVEVVL